MTTGTDNEAEILKATENGRLVPPELVALRVAKYAPLAVGVPVIAPLVELIDRPGGNPPAE